MDPNYNNNNQWNQNGQNPPTDPNAQWQSTPDGGQYQSYQSPQPNAWESQNNGWNNPQPDNSQQWNQQPYQQPYNPQGQQPEQKGFSIASLVLGILSVVCCGAGLFGILGLIFGIMGQKRAPSSKGMATAGIVLSAIGIVLFIVIIFMSAVGALDNFWHNVYYSY